MDRSRLPLPSLLSLFGALLMLSPELLLGTPEELSHLPLTDLGVQRALSFAGMQYNRLKFFNKYFKVLRVLKAQSQLETRYEYHLTVELVKTTCARRVCCKLTFEEIQMCEQLPGNPEKQTCYLKVIARYFANFQVISYT